MESGFTVELYWLRANRNLIIPSKSSAQIAKKEGRPEAAFVD
jgi:hypothetical protein